VDDSPDNLFLIQAILEEEGYEIDSVGDGATALAKVEQSPPDLIILDVIMPGIDGYEVTRRIRNNPNLPFIPILLISAFTESSVVEGLDTGANDFIRKPITVDELLARVRSLLRLKQSIDERDRTSRVNLPIPQTTEIAENLVDVLKKRIKKLVKVKLNDFLSQQQTQKVQSL
jgi:DNA-binding response OmpR family regulator